MIEATIKKIYGERDTITKALTGARVSCASFEKRNSPPDTYYIRVCCIIKTKKGSRIRREKYEGTWLQVVDLEDIVEEEYDED